MVRNRLTAAILVGSPVLVIAMLATLFRRGTVVSDPVAGVQLAYWIAFAGFFFGLTYGLLQIVTETAVLRRELSWGMSLTAYVTSKLVVLLPLLVAVDVSLFAVLRAAGPVAGGRRRHLGQAGRRLPPRRDGRSRSRAAGVGVGDLAGSGHPGTADAVLPAGALLRAPWCRWPP